VGGGAVKAGPSGPPAGEALTAPVSCRQPQWDRDAERRPCSRWDWLDTAVTSPLAPRTGRGRPWGSADGHSFVPTVRGAWCVPATAGRAALSSPASPEGGHVDLRARAVAVSEPCSTGLPGEAADLAVAQPLKDEAEQFPCGSHPGDHHAPALGDARERRGDGGAAVVAGDGLDRRPPHQRRALFGDMAAVDLGGTPGGWASGPPTSTGAERRRTDRHRRSRRP
jgi:hypothetical protein